MKAMIINGYGGPDVLELADLAVPLAQPDEVLVRVKAAAVNPADYKWRAGMFASFMPVSFPHILGYDVAGEVVEGGALTPGTRVFAMLDPLQKGGYAEYVAVPAALLAVMPNEMAFSTAAAIPTAGLTGLQMVERALNVQPGQTILVTGASGAVGRFALHAAKARGARVIAAVRGAHSDAACALGADAVITLGESDGNGESFDHLLDTVGGEGVARLAAHLKPGGRIVTAATDPIPADGRSAVPEFFAVSPDGHGLARVCAMASSGAVPVPIAQTMPLEQASIAHQRVEQGGQGGKIILTP